MIAMTISLHFGNFKASKFQTWLLGPTPSESYLQRQVRGSCDCARISTRLGLPTRAH
ncbi:hypothetical protein PAXRUDRAFT_552875 [Paxillus rubicundulus Ve08.2h10]|uniref:Uncharacterized protein n=1 Tax=Paxillus rubicundulus Ve08.2h10 TaxID=930991 RepID=A0A0D0DL37_9AGAM|nr:hypothetical protein PAXRUDRAFT_552875 [Paxillus rubicundulus Ve08.2h10]